MTKKSIQARRRPRRRASKRDWTCLPPELLDLIARKLTICDYIKFRSVCAAWRCSAVTYHHKLPLLILPHGEYGCTIPFFNPADRHIHEFPLPIEARGTFALGSSYGWLVMLDYYDNSVSLLNPITQAHIILPPWPYDAATGRVLLCCNPTDPPMQPRQLLLVTITSKEELFIYRHGDDYWTVIEKPPEFSRILDIAYLKEEAALYVVDMKVGGIAVLDLASSSLRPLTNNTPDSEIGCLRLAQHLVVTSAGELLLVAWDHGPDVVPHPQFDIFKLNKSDEGRFKWVRSTNISGSMLFQSGEEVIEVCDQEFIGDRANQIYCLNGKCFHTTKNEIKINARVDIWDIGTRSSRYWSPPLTTFFVSTTTKTKKKGNKSLGFTWMIPSFS